MSHIRRIGNNLLGLMLIGAPIYFGLAATATSRAVSTVQPNTWTCSQGDAAPTCSGSAIAPMPTARGRLAAVTAPGGTLTQDVLVYAIGGYTLANGGAVLSSFEAYDPTSNSWLAAPTLPAMPTARASLAAVLGPDGQTIYAFGGATQKQINDTLIAGATATVEAFNPNAGTWACSTGDSGAGCATTTIPPLPTARVGLAAATGADGLIYTFGGYNATATGGQTSVTFFGSVEAYNPQTNSWICSIGDAHCSTLQQQLPAMPTPRGGLRAILGPDGQTIYALGGFTATVSASGAPTFTYYSLVEAFHPQNPLQNSTWNCSSGDSACPSPQPALPALFLATQGFGAATAANGAIYVFGGALNSGPLQATNVNQAFVPTNSETVPAPNMPTGRRNLGGALGPNGLIYAIGGTTSASPSVPETDVALVEAFQPPPVVTATFIWLPNVQNGPAVRPVYLPVVSN